MQRRSVSSRRFKTGTCQLREKALTENIDPRGLLGGCVGLTSEPRKMICSEIRKGGQGSHRAVESIMLTMMLMKLKLIYDRQPVGQSVLVSGTHLVFRDEFFFLLEIFFRQLRVCYFVAPSLTRRRICYLLLLLVLASANRSDLSPAGLKTKFYCPNS
jgi:hypothetical protein